MITAASLMEPPPPPYSSGMSMASQPASVSAWTNSLGYRRAASTSVQYSWSNFLAMPETASTRAS